MEGSQPNNKKDMKPFLLKLGVAVALSLAGFLRLRPRNELRTLESEDSLVKPISPRSNKSSGDEEGYLLPDFNQLFIEEFEESDQNPESGNRKFEIEKESAMQEEIRYLRNIVGSLQEREETLEIQMLEYHGLREQESSIKELENRLKINLTEAKLFSLKTEALRAENQRLRDELSNYSRAMNELGSVREMIRFLERKLMSDGEQSKEKISALEQRITVLQESAQKKEEDDAAVGEKLSLLKELKDELVELRKANSMFAEENAELKQKLKPTQTQEAELLKEADCLREENAKLEKDIGQLQIDRCADIEELVYLRWVNACLRYELRNYQPPQGKTVARDLSRSLSPDSEERIKQLIVEYANFGIDEKNVSLGDFDWDCFSSQASNEELDDTLPDVSSMTRNKNSRKSKFISKLKKLVLGKGNHADKISPIDRRASISACSYDDTIGRRSNDSGSSCISEEFASASQSSGIRPHTNDQWHNRGARHQSLSRPPVDSRKIERLDLRENSCKSDVGTSYGYKSTMYEDDSPIDPSPNSSLDHLHIEVSDKVELRKFAEALKNSRGSPKLKKRAASFSHR